MLRFLCVFACVSIAIASLPNCQRKYKLEKVGCFGDSQNPRPLDELLVNMRDPSSNAYRGYILDWGNMKPSVDKILCDCSQRAFGKGYTYFGLQAFGECWSGAGTDYGVDGASTSCKNPMKIPYQPCSDGDNVACVGMPKTNYVYKIVPVYDGNWQNWGEVSVCSKPCGGGQRFRKRVCKPTGASCKGSDVEATPCNTEKCEDNCHEKVDIGIVLDASGSVTAPNFQIMREFVAKLTSYYGVNSDEVHFGAMHYSFRPTIDWRINNKDYWDNARLASKILQIPYTRGGTRTDLALKAAEQNFFCGNSCGRPGAQRALIVFTDGKNNVYLSSSVTASMKANGVKVIAVGIKGAVLAELERIASNPKDVINIKDFKYLVDKINKIIHLTCERLGKPHPSHYPTVAG